ncbi:MAG: winged helix DNA-binding protein [Sphingobium sp.]|nr:winged helix DNA-binding protein [Sphingobium sp.]
MTGSDRSDDEPLAQDLLYPRLVTLIQLIDESAAIAYPRTLHRHHLTRMLVFLIGLSGNVASSDLVFAAGYEKAQISRGLKGLTEAGLIDRPEPRGPIRLNEAGRTLFEQIMIIARERDARLREGLTQGDVQRFLEMTGMLIEHTSRLVAEDEPGVEEVDGPQVEPLHAAAEPERERRRTSISAPSVHDLILPALRSLMVYIRRNGSSLFRRQVGLANLEWRVLTLIAENVPISLSALIPLAARDKSQVARAVKQLHAIGLVRRHDEGRVNVRLELTSAGIARHDQVRAIRQRHDGLVFAGFRPDQRRFYLDILSRITRNAAALLAAEEANIGEPEIPERCHEAHFDGTKAELDRLRAENHRLRQQLAGVLEELAGLRGKSG